MALVIANKFPNSPVTGGSTTCKFGTSPVWTPTTGNTVVFGVTHGSVAGVTSVADTLGNSYIKKGSVVTPGTTAVTLDVYECTHCTGGSANIITVTFTGTATFPAGYLYEISGTASGDPADIFATGTSTAGLTTFSTGAFTTTNPNELVLVFATGNAAGAQFAAAGGYTLDQTNFGTSGGVFWGVEHNLFSTIQTGVVASITPTGTSNNGYAMAAIGIQAPRLSVPNSLMMLGCGT